MVFLVIHKALRSISNIFFEQNAVVTFGQNPRLFSSFGITTKGFFMIRFESYNNVQKKLSEKDCKAPYDT